MPMTLTFGSSCLTDCFWSLIWSILWKQPGPDLGYDRTHPWLCRRRALDREIIHI